MRFLIIQHVDFEGPANIEKWILSKPYHLKIIKPYRGDDFPDLNSFDNLIIMGGPMSVHDDHQYPWLSAEKNFIYNTLEDQSKKIMGVCLGSQLVAQALRSPVYRNNQSEIGWFPVQWNETELMAQLGLAFQTEQTVLHWHGDAFDLPYGATQLASSKATKVQAYIFERRILGLLFHLEMNEINLQEMLEFAGTDLNKTGDFIQNKDQISSNKNHFKTNELFLHKLLIHFFENE